MTKLLIVDDEKNIRIGLKTMIEREFPGLYDLTTAAQGAEALELYRAQGADIMITDIRMPVMDGIALIEQVSEGPLPAGQIGRRSSSSSAGTRTLDMPKRPSDIKPSIIC
ncbi:hypothetical protein HMSSN139_15750 [Paenibacillus sp. HMSSN-139]|nr:hypothetical protein HMSSN139_15750 [Paenibacillus sp. HMSSN-139]